MNTKISIIAGAVVLALAGNANAAITSSQANFSNDQLFLSVYDSVSQTSYTRGLGITIGSMISGAGINFGSKTDGSLFTAAGDTAANNYTLSADTNLAGFLSANKADAASIQWNVVAGGDNVNAYGTTGYISTSNAIQSASDLAIRNMTTFNGTYIPAVNGLMPVGSVLGNTDSVSTNATSGGAAYAGGASSNFASNFGTSAPFSNTAGLDVAQSVYLLTPESGSRGYNGIALEYKFGNANGMSTFNLSSTGNLSYTVAAVPEPGEWAMLASGLAMLGFIATRRSKKA